MCYAIHPHVRKLGIDTNQEVNNGWRESQAGEALYEVHEEDEAHHRANRPLVFSSPNAGTSLQ